MQDLYHITQMPSAVDAASALPMIVLLHGYGSNESDLMGLSPFLDKRLIKIGVRAPLPLDFGGNAWFPIEVTDGGINLQLDRVGECLTGIHDLVRALKIQYCAAQIFLLGFSQGASMALSAAFFDPDLYDGVAALSGVVIPEMLPADPGTALNGLPVIMTHGRQDAVIPIEQGRSSHRLLQSLPLTLCYHEYDMGHEINQECLTDVGDWLTAQIDGADEDAAAD
jgi:phospholipase/carboxylesterase